MALDDAVQVTPSVLAQAVCPDGPPIWIVAAAGPGDPVRNAVGPVTAENLIVPFCARLSTSFTLRSPYAELAQPGGRRLVKFLYVYDRPRCFQPSFGPHPSFGGAPPPGTMRACASPVPVVAASVSPSDTGSMAGGTPTDLTVPLIRNFWSPGAASRRWNLNLTGWITCGQVGGGSLVGIAAAPISSSPSGDSLNAWMAGNGLWNVVPPSRLNQAVMRSVVSSKLSRSAKAPLTEPKSIGTTWATGGSWLPSGKTRENCTE